MGPHSKMIVTGDSTQVDLPSHQKSGLSDSLQILKHIKGIGQVHLDAKDVVRHKIVKEIIQAYDDAQAKPANKTK